MEEAEDEEEVEEEEEEEEGKDIEDESSKVIEVLEKGEEKVEEEIAVEESVEEDREETEDMVAANVKKIASKDEEMNKGLDEDLAAVERELEEIQKKPSCAEENEPKKGTEKKNTDEKEDNEDLVEEGQTCKRTITESDPETAMDESPSKKLKTNKEESREETDGEAMETEETKEVVFTPPNSPSLVETTLKNSQTRPRFVKHCFSNLIRFSIQINKISFFFMQIFPQDDKE